MAGPKRRLFWEILIPALAGFAFVVIVSIPFQRWNPQRDALVNKEAPDVFYTLRTGGETSLKKNRGQTVLLHFWASWCAPCVVEMPALAKLEQTLARQDFVLMAFNVDPSESRATALRNGVEYPHNLIFNTESEFLQPYGISAIPVSVLIDKKGTIREVFRGPQDWTSDENRRKINILIRE